MTALTLNLEAISRITYEQFRALCQTNPDLRFELTAIGELIAMSPTGWESGNRNIKLAAQVQNWTAVDGTGMAFDSSTGFMLPNGAIRSPDVAWVRKDRLDTLKPDPNTFLPLAPDFVIELRSATDRLKPLQEKMQEYMDNGVQLGWLLNAKDKAVEIYRAGKDVEVLNSPMSLSGENILPGFILDISEIYG
jgi:Uma2 family endonuclease